MYTTDSFICTTPLLFAYNYSRFSLFRLSEVRPPRYTGHNFGSARNASYNICLLHKTQPQVRPFAIPYTGQCWPGFQCNFIRLLRPDMTFWVWFGGLHLTLYLHILETRTAKLVIRFEVRSFLAAAIF